MKVLVNGDWRDVSSDLLATALQELGYRESVFATAVNGTVVPSSARTEATLREGDRIEVLAPMQGG
ncbi:MAG: sulfur carrier protein ThiS [Steroidobacter sp.]